MRRASEERSRQLDQQAADSKAHFERQAVDSKVYFERQAVASEAYFERQAADSERRHQEMMQSLAEEREQRREDNHRMMRALETLIERTAPSSSPSPPLVVLG